MKLIKKIFVILLAICLCAGLCACSNADRFYTDSDYRQSNKKISSKNGFSTKEELLGAYITMSCLDIVSKKEYEKIYPEQLWESGWEGINLDENYEQYKRSALETIENLKERFGNNYHLAWEITSVEDNTNYGDYTDEERQECLELFGVEPEEHYMYMLEYSVSVNGGEHTYHTGIVVRKIANKWYFY